MKIKEEFLKDVEEHEIDVIKDDGFYRHIRFKHPLSWNYWFDLLTWEGNLCITGDIGAHVFSRVDDMFKFFRSETLEINDGYSAEKLLASCVRSGVKKFCFEAFRDRVKDYYDSFAEDNEDELGSLEMQKLWEEISESVLDEGEQGEFFAYHAVQEFEWTFHKDGVKLTFDFQDFFLDGGNTEAYTHHYIWCLYAIVWGINKYDKYKDSLSRK